MKTWTVDELRRHIGEAFTAERPSTEGEIAAGDSPTMGGCGILEYVGQDVGDPWLRSDDGMITDVAPGTAVAFDSRPTDEGILATRTETARMLALAAVRSLVAEAADTEQQARELLALASSIRQDALAAMPEGARLRLLGAENGAYRLDGGRWIHPDGAEVEAEFIERCWLHGEAVIAETAEE